MKTIIKLSIILCLIFFSIDATAQRKPVFERVQQAKSGGTGFKALSNAVVMARENRELPHNLTPINILFPNENCI